MRVFVYFNLHHRCWSIRAASVPERGRVIAHADQVSLSNVTPSVSERGRQRVIAEGRKSVHAGLTGDLTCFTGTRTEAGRRAGVWALPEGSKVDDRGMTPITYNPFKFAHFVTLSGHERIDGPLDRAVMTPTGVKVDLSEQEAA